MEFLITKTQLRCLRNNFISVLLFVLLDFKCVFLCFQGSGRRYQQLTVPQDTEAKPTLLQEGELKDPTTREQHCPGHLTLPGCFQARPRCCMDLGPHKQFTPVQSSLEGHRLSLSASWLQGQKKKHCWGLVVSTDSC